LLKGDTPELGEAGRRGRGSKGRTIPNSRISRTKEGLEALKKRYGADYINSDPLELVHRFSAPEDQEIVGLLASSLAFGNVTAIRRSLERLLQILGNRPWRYLRAIEPRRGLQNFRGFHHRWITGRDVVCLLFFARQMFDQAGSIGNYFRRFYEAEQGDMRRVLARFSGSTLTLDHGGLYRGEGLPRTARVRYFFPSPEAGGACKRLNLYLRWMVRPRDGLDLGLWSFVSPSSLVIPLDTHMSRIGRHMRWTTRKTPGWKMAVDITRSLAEVAPEDPTRYDFALTRMGILEGCPRHTKNDSCELCNLKKYVRRRDAR
jgi:uncharacterized protein (TIGR02757 family)